MTLNLLRAAAGSRTGGAGFLFCSGVDLILEGHPNVKLAGNRDSVLDAPRLFPIIDDTALADRHSKTPTHPPRTGRLLKEREDQQ